MIDIYGFLDDYPSLRKHCDTLEYAGIESPIDGVFYPGVDINIPEDVKSEIKEKLDAMFGGVDLKYLFLRLSPKGVYAPHQAHNDESMGTHSMMLYLNRKEHCQGGTSFVSYKDGGLTLEKWEEDHSKPEKWEVESVCGMFENKACIFEAGKMHRSEPIGGFGSDAKDGRLVMVGFFDVS